MKYLVDANVLSEAAKPSPEERVLEWLFRNELEIGVDPIVLGEIRFGILLLPNGTRRRELEDWFDRGIRHLPCLPWDERVAFRWAQLLADLRLAGTTMSIKDSLIAATALTSGLIVATRNVKDFLTSGVQILNPFDAAAS